MGEDSHHDNHHHATAGEVKRPSYESNPTYKLMVGAISILDGPVTFFKERIMDPLRARNTPVYYHRNFKRVPTIDQCEVEDYVCMQEANEQMIRDKRVDKEITYILQSRVEECLAKEGQYDAIFRCQALKKELDESLTNYFIKYGDLPATATAIDVYMKQKHRLIWQRRNPDKDIFGISKGSERKQKTAERAVGRVFDEDRDFK